MPKKFSSTVSYLIVTFFLAAIVISFVFTGAGSSRVTKSGVAAVAEVDGNSIGVDEYNRVLQGQIDYYSKMMGGKSLSSREIEMFGLKQRALQGLVEQKILANWADDLDLYPGKVEVKEEIKSLPYFLSNGNFDLNKYKTLLRANHYTPNDFEARIADDVKMKKVQQLMGYFWVSQKHVDDMNAFRQESLQATAIQIEKDDLARFIAIPEQQIVAFVQEKKNEGRLAALYEKNKSRFETPEKVQARHILIRLEDGKDVEAQKKIEEIAKKVTVKNFAQMADKYTEDPSGKGKGGSLGIFERGKMVKEFEKVAFDLKANTISKPVKTMFGYHIILVEKHFDKKVTPMDVAYRDLAKEELQKEQKKELDKFASTVASELASAIQKPKELASAKKKYLFELEEGKDLNLLDGRVGKIELKEDELKQIFKPEGMKEDIFIFNSGTMLKVVATSKKKESKTKKEEPRQDYFANKLANTLREKFMEQLKEEATVKVFGNL